MDLETGMRNCKFKVPWILQDIRDARAIRYLPRKATKRKWNQPKRKNCVAATMMKGIRNLERHHA